MAKQMQHDDIEDDDVYSLSEELRGPPEEVLKRIFGVDRQQWGWWKLDAEHEVLAYQGDPKYPALDYWIRLSELKSGEAVYDWIRQVEGKTWLTEEQLGHFVRAVLPF